MACSPSGTGCSSVGPPRGHKPCQETCSGMGCSPQVHRSCWEPAPACAAHGFTASFRHPPAPAWGFRQAAGGDPLYRGPPWTAGGQPASPWSSLWAERNLCSSTWSISSPSFFTDLGVYRVVSFTSSHSSLSTAISLQVFPLLKYVVTEALPPLLIGLALASGGSILELAGTGFIRHGGSFSQLLTEATPIAHPATKTLPCKPTTKMQKANTRGFFPFSPPHPHIPSR